MINFLSLHTEANPAITGLAHAHGSSYPLSGCTYALPFSVSLDSVKVGKISTDTVQLTLPCYRMLAGKYLWLAKQYRVLADEYRVLATKYRWLVNKYL